MMDQRVGGGEQEGRTKLIGLELRVVLPDGRQEEIAVFPLDVDVPSRAPYNYYDSCQWNVTLHTSKGDDTIGNGNGNGRIP